MNSASATLFVIFRARIDKFIGRPYLNIPNDYKHVTLSARSPISWQSASYQV